MKLSSKHPIRSLPRRLLHQLENAFRTEPSNTHGMKWFDQRDTALFRSFRPPKPLPVTSFEPDWRWSTPEPYSGICAIKNARLWMMSKREGRPLDTDERLAIIFTRRYRRLNCPRSPNIMQYFRRGGWKRWWSSRHDRVHLEGRTAVIGNRVFDYRNYYHFWADAIADIWYLNQMLPEDQRLQRYLIVFDDAPWQRQILKICGVRPDQIIPFQKHEWLTAETLLVPVRDKGSDRLPSWSAHAIREMAGWKNNRKPGTRLIFLSREDASRRRVINEVRIRERFITRGFEIHTLDGLDVREQQNLFASAAIIVAPHGAALTNLMWCHSGTLVVDFLSENNVIPCFRELAWQSQVFYLPILCRQIEDGKIGILGDFEIKFDQVDIALKAIDQHLHASSAQREENSANQSSFSFDKPEPV